METDYYTFDFLPSIQRWVVLDPTGEIVASGVSWEAVRDEMHRLNYERSIANDGSDGTVIVTKEES